MQSGTHSAILLRKIACWWTAPNPPEQLHAGAGCAFLRNALSRAAGPRKNAGCNMAICPLHPAPYEEKRWMHRHYWKSSSKAYILERFSENLS